MKGKPHTFSTLFGEEKERKNAFTFSNQRVIPAVRSVILDRSVESGTLWNNHLTYASVPSNAKELINIKTKGHSLYFPIQLCYTMSVS